MRLYRKSRSFQQAKADVSGEYYGTRGRAIANWVQGKEGKGILVRPAVLLFREDCEDDLGSILSRTKLHLGNVIEVLIYHVVGNASRSFSDLCTLGNVYVVCKSSKNRGSFGGKSRMDIGALYHLLSEKGLIIVYDPTNGKVGHTTISPKAKDSLMKAVEIAPTSREMNQWAADDALPNMIRGEGRRIVDLNSKLTVAGDRFHLAPTAASVMEWNDGLLTKAAKEVFLIRRNFSKAAKSYNKESLTAAQVIHVIRCVEKCDDAAVTCVGKLLWTALGIFVIFDAGESRLVELRISSTHLHDMLAEWGCSVDDFESANRNSNGKFRFFKVMNDSKGVSIKNFAIPQHKAADLTTKIL